MLEDVVDALEGLRIRVLYDSRQALVGLLFGELLPIFYQKRMRINFIIHSEHALRKVRIISNQYDPSLFRDVRMFKVGSNNYVPFGRLTKFIEMKDEELFSKLIEIFRSFDEEKDVVFLFGFYTIPFFHNNSIQKILDLFEATPAKLTVIMPQPIGVFDRSIDIIIGKIFDVDFVIKRIEGEYFEESYTVQLEQSIVPGLRFFAKMEISDGKPKWFRSI